MNREGWIYALAFLLILGVGALIIVPRITRAPAGLDDPIPSAPEPPLPEPPPPLPPAPEPDLLGAPVGSQAPWVEVEVRKTGGGALAGPLKLPYGAETEGAPPTGLKDVRLRLRALDARVAVGAYGHQWTWFAAGELRDGAVLELPPAAPTLAVEVVEADGRPAADVPVRIEPAAPGPLPRTDASGVLLLDHLVDGLVILDATTPERAGQRKAVRTGKAGRVRLQLEPAWEVRGRVVSSEDLPVADAIVEAFGSYRLRLGRETRTGADGRFVWRGRPAAVTAFRVRHADHAELSVEVTPPARGALRSELGELRFSGPGVRVRAALDADLRRAGARAFVEPAVAARTRELFGPAAILDQPREIPIPLNGRLEVSGLAPHVPWRIAVRGVGRPVDAVVAGEPGELIELTWEAQAGHRVAGHLFWPDGSPASGVRLLFSREARDGDKALPDDEVVWTGPSGGFDLRGLDGEIWYLRAYATGHRSLLRQLVMPLAERLELTFEPALTDASRRVAGRIVDPSRLVDGVPTPLAGVTVRAAGVKAVTDTEGRFVLDGVESVAPDLRMGFRYEPGPLPAGVSDVSGMLVPQVVAIKPGVDVDGVWRLRQGGSLTLRLVDGVDLDAVTCAHLLVRFDMQGGPVLFDRVVTTSDGRLTLEDLPWQGVVLSLATTDRFARRESPVEAGVTTDLGEVEMPRGMRVRGVVKGSDGIPLRNALVAVLGEGWHARGRDLARERALSYRVVTTDEDGAYTLQGLDPRERNLLVAWSPLRPPVFAEAKLPDASDAIETRVDFEIPEGGTLNIILRDQERRFPVEGANLDLETGRGGVEYLDLLFRGALGSHLGSSDDWIVGSARLLHEQGEPGRYQIGPLVPGPYELWIELPGYEPYLQKLTVLAPGQNIFASRAQATRVDAPDGSRGRWLYGTDDAVGLTLQSNITRMSFEMTPRK